jgi:hypothetical protein
MIARIGWTLVAYFSCAACGSAASSPGVDGGGEEASAPGTSSVTTDAAPQGAPDGALFSAEAGAACTAPSPGCPCATPGEVTTCTTESSACAGTITCMAAGEGGGVWGSCDAPIHCPDAGDVPEASVGTPEAAAPVAACGAGVGCSAIPPAQGWSAFTCETCTYYSEFDGPPTYPNIGPLTGCVSSWLDAPDSQPPEVYMCGHDWTINFTCTPVDPTECM